MEIMVKYLMQQNDPLLFAKQICAHANLEVAEQVLDLLTASDDEIRIKEVLILLQEDTLPRIPLIHDRLTYFVLQKFESLPKEFAKLAKVLVMEERHAEKLVDILAKNEVTEHYIEPVWRSANSTFSKAKCNFFATIKQ